MKTILVAVAEPANSRQPAVDRATRLAAATGAHVVLFHAAFEAALSGRPFFDSRRLAKSRGWFVAERLRELEKHAVGLRQARIPVAAYVVWEEPAHDAIIRAALRENADLVVAGTHERRQDAPPRLRLTDWELMRLCPRPVLLVQPRPRPRTRASGAVLAALDPNHAHDKPASLDVSIAEHTATIAEALQLPCHAVHCVPDVTYPRGRTDGARVPRLARMRASVGRIMKSAGAPQAEVHLLRGNVAATISQLVRSLPAEILVMGIVSRRGLKRLMIGDTAETIIHAATCDVLLIKPATFRLRLGRSRKQAIVTPKRT